MDSYDNYLGSGFCCVVLNIIFCYSPFDYLIYKRSALVVSHLSFVLLLLNLGVVRIEEIFADQVVCGARICLAA